MNRAAFMKWLKDTLIRAIKTTAQTVLAAIGTSSVVLTEFDWGFVLMTAGMAGLISLLMSLERLPEGDNLKIVKSESVTTETNPEANKGEKT